MRSCLSHVQPGHAWLSQHYKWGLDKVFWEQNHSHAIIIEVSTLRNTLGMLGRIGATLGLDFRIFMLEHSVIALPFLLDRNFCLCL